MLLNLREWWDRIKEKGFTRKALFALLFLGASALLAKLYFEPQWRKLTLLRGELSQLQMAVEDAQQKGWDDVAALKYNIDKTKNEQTKLYEEVPRIKDIPGLVVSIYELVCRYQLKVPKGIVFSNLQEYPEGYAAFDASLTVEGKSASVYEFMKAVENLPRQVAVVKSSLVAGEPDSLRGDLVLRIFVLKEITSDPDYYPFMEFKRIEQKPYQIFGADAVAENLEGEEILQKMAQCDTTAGEERESSGAAYSSTFTYQVKEGDTLQSIAMNSFGNQHLWPLLAKINNLEPPYQLRPGDVILLPEKTYTVEAGDSLQSISVKIYGTEEHWQELAEINYIPYPYRLCEGQKLVLPQREERVFK